MTDNVFAFGGYRLDASRRLLFTAGDVVVPLNSRAFDTLLHFVQHPKELLDKATLLAAVWPNTVVEDNNLNQCIAALRRALGESPGDHRFIVTVPGRGYRFVAPVHLESIAPVPDPVPYTIPAPVPAPPAAASIWHIRGLAIVGVLLLAAVIGLTAGRSGTRVAFAPASSTLPSIAVLPLADLSTAQDQEALADGLSEELLAQLDRQPGITTIGRGSSFAFKGRSEDLRRVGRQLGADYVLEGSVRRGGDRVRVTLHLVETARGTRVWSDSVERTPGDALTLQDEVARSVVPAVAEQMGRTPAR